jgi:hypothetical protein
MVGKLIGSLMGLGIVLAIAPGCSKSSNPADSGGPGGGAVEFSSPTLGNGASFQHVFMTAKTMNYYCSFHGTATSGMFATITVTAGGTPSLIQSNITNSTLQTLNIDVGDTVRWTNNHAGMQHNVRSAN